MSLITIINQILILNQNLLIKQIKTTNLLSLCEIVPSSNFLEFAASTLQASFAKSKSLTSVGDTEIKANASLSSLIGAQPT